jgi:S1-C subfamily serine protease
MGVPGDLLDGILLALMLMFAVSGYRHGFIVGLLSLAGFLAGVSVGGLVALAVARFFTSSPSWRALLAILVVFVISVTGMLLASRVGVALRLRLTGRGRVTRIDSVAGAVMNGLAVLVIVWVIAALADSAAPASAFSREVKGSLMLSTVHRVMPPSLNLTTSPTLRDLVNVGMYTSLFAALRPGTTSLPAPHASVVDSAAVRRDKQSIVMISAPIPSCKAGVIKSLQGSGFVISPQHVLTNAHVVTGLTGRPTVTAGGRRYKATVVRYDSNEDVAVLYVPGLHAPALTLGDRAQYGVSGVMAGYPGGLKLTLSPVTIGLSGEDSTATNGVSSTKRQVYTLRADVQPGNSGGPLLASNGTVYGVVFAKATPQPDVGYALTAHQVEGDATAGEHLFSPVPTGHAASCPGA